MQAAASNKQKMIWMDSRSYEQMSRAAQPHTSSSTHKQAAELPSNEIGFGLAWMQMQVQRNKAIPPAAACARSISERATSSSSSK